MNKLLLIKNKSEKYYAPIDLLTDDVLIKIFNSFFVWDVKDIFSKVCKKWYDIINNYPIPIGVCSPGKIEVYTINYNLYRIEMGMGGISFAS